jgi:hypothetical protein
MGRVAENEGDVDRAELAYREALKRDKRRGDARLHLANIQTLKGQYRLAAEEYQRALEINPGNPDVFCDMGYSLYLQRKLDAAERNLKQALAIDPNHHRAHNNLALVLAHTDRPEQALSEFRKGGSSAADAQVNLTFSLALDKRWQPAREAYRRALAAKPSTEIARSRLVEIGRLISANDRPNPRIDATRDTQTVAASTAGALAVSPPVAPATYAPTTASSRVVSNTESAPGSLATETKPDSVSPTALVSPTTLVSPTALVTPAALLKPAPVSDDSTPAQPAPVSGSIRAKPAPVSDSTSAKLAPVSDSAPAKPAPVSDSTPAKLAPVSDSTPAKPAPVSVVSAAKPASKTKIPPPKPPTLTGKQTRPKIPPPRVILQPPTALP